MFRRTFDTIAKSNIRYAQLKTLKEYLDKVAEELEPISQVAMDINVYCIHRA